MTYVASLHHSLSTTALLSFTFSLVTRANFCNYTMNPFTHLPAIRGAIGAVDGVWGWMEREEREIERKSMVMYLRNSITSIVREESVSIR